MIDLSNIKKIYVYQKKVDLRYGINKLSILAQELVALSNMKHTLFCDTVYLQEAYLCPNINELLRKKPVIRTTKIFVIRFNRSDTLPQKVGDFLGSNVK